MMTLPLHHHDMEAGIICDKNGKAVIQVQDNLDADDVLRAVNAHEKLLANLKWLHEKCLCHEQGTENECSAVEAIAKAEGRS